MLGIDLLEVHVDFILVLKTYSIIYDKGPEPGLKFYLYFNLAWKLHLFIITNIVARIKSTNFLHYF